MSFEEDMESWRTSIQNGIDSLGAVSEEETEVDEVEGIEEGDLGKESN